MKLSKNIIKAMAIEDMHRWIFKFVSGRSLARDYDEAIKVVLELLLKEDGSVKLIRRAETPKDYFATFDGLDIYKKLGF